MSNILILGTGCIGSVYACVLNAVPLTRVTCVCRSNYDAVKTNGLQVSSSILGDMSSRPVVVRTAMEATAKSDDPFDFVIVSTKATKKVTGEVIDQIRPALTPQRTCIVLIQNGLGVEKPFYDAFPDIPIISAVPYMPTTQVSPASFVHSEVELLHLGLYPAAPISKQLQTIASLIRQGGATVKTHDDIQAERWCKIVANGTINPICALSRCRDRELAQLSTLGVSLFRAVMQEIRTVAASAGYGNVITSEVVSRQLSRTLSRPLPGVQPSMMKDALDGKAMEVEAVVGEIVRIAQETNTSIPRLSTLYVLLIGLDNSFQCD